MTAGTSSSAIEGVKLFELTPFVDDRGSFLKVFQQSRLVGVGLTTEVAECYFARSERGVLRGFHYQVEPCSHAKLVACVEGEVIDVIVDVKPSSPTFRK